MPNSQASSAILSKYEPVIGLEVHCQLNTLTKLFCACSTQFGVLPNMNTCPTCLGLPGALPVLNKNAVDLGLRFALGVGSRINQLSRFDRKQYFYPDLPKGYQITQLFRPYCEGGGITLASGKYIRLHHIHLEEDAGKNTHAAKGSFVDLNRAGTPLMEIVSEPDIRTAEEASEYLKRLRNLARHLDVSDGNLEEGSFRCDANVSLRPRGETKLGTRCEIKNLNSFKNIERAINYEILRQADVLDSGEQVRQNTMLFDPASGKTKVMRSKEDAMDYRYFPEPDLKPVMITDERLTAALEALPELPDAMARRYMMEYSLTDYDAGVITADRDLARYFEAVISCKKAQVTPKAAANFLITEFMREANERDWPLEDPPIAAEDFAELMSLMGDETISGKIAKKVFLLMAGGGGKPVDIVRENSLVQVKDEGAILKVIKEVLDTNQSQVAEFLGGKEKVMGFFVGQIMKASGGKLNPGLVNQHLRAELERRR